MKQKFAKWVGGTNCSPYHKDKNNNSHSSRAFAAGKMEKDARIKHSLGQPILGAFQKKREKPTR